MANAGLFVTGGGPRGGRTNQLKQLGYGVGNYSFLDSEQNRAFRYWRQIEFGSDVHVGRFLGGAWGGAGGGRGARHGQALTQFGAGEGQQFIPFSTTMEPGPTGAGYSSRRAAQLLKEQGARKADRESHFGTGGYILRPIEPHEAYARAFRKFNAAEKEKQAIMQLFGRLIREAGSKPLRDLSAANLSNIGDFMTVRVLSAPNVRLLQNDTSSGALGPFGSRLTALNRILAEELALAVAEELVLVRPDVSTGTLKETIVDPRNRFPQ